MTIVPKGWVMIDEYLAANPVGSQFMFNGTTLTVTRHTVNDGCSVGPGITARYLDANGVIRELLVYPADFEAMLLPPE